MSSSVLVQLPMSQCPAWCAIGAGHGFNRWHPADDLYRDHQHTLDAAAGVSVTVVQGEIVSDGLVGEPRINVRVADVGLLESLTGEQATQLAAILPELLTRAAQLVNQVGAP